MQKHAVTIRGHRTSVSLEPEFWEALKQLAAARAVPLAALITEIDAARGPNATQTTLSAGLSSAIRLYVLRTFQKAR